MIILDTDVVSALMRPERNVAVVNWVESRQRAELWTTAITLHEVLYGLARAPHGKSKRALAQRFEELLATGLAEHILAFDIEAARRASAVRLIAERKTGHCDLSDALIAGIALVHGASIATRNVGHFKHFGVPIVDPWAG